MYGEKGGEMVALEIKCHLNKKSENESKVIMLEVRKRR